MGAINKTNDIFKKILKEAKERNNSNDGDKIIQVTVTNQGYESVIKLLEMLQTLGSFGASRDIGIVDDRDGEMPKNVGWDGDGSSKILDIKTL